MQTYISSLGVDAFRGIPGHLNVDFTGTSGRPLSLLLLGDNGTGKSTVADALEFGLQGRLRKSGDLESLRSLVTDALPTVSVTLSDGETVERRLISKESEHFLIDQKPHPSFAVSPFVLRRSDILNFIGAPGHERQRVFWEFLRYPQISADSEYITQDELERLLKERQNLKKKRAVVVSRIAALLGVAEESIPLEIQQFHQYIKGLQESSAFDRARIAPLTKDMREVSADISRCTQRLGNWKKVKRWQIGPEERQRIESVLTRVGDTLTEAFIALSTSSFVERIEVLLGDLSRVSMRLQLTTSNGKRCRPEEILSEANLDLLAMLFFLSISLESHANGQAPVLVLDDVVQSVDATVRLAVFDFVLKAFNNWQIIVTVHDRFWFSQLCDLFRRHGREFNAREIMRWSFQDGPTIVGARDDAALLSDAVVMGVPSQVCSHAGMLLEQVCGNLSWRLPVSVTRRRDDRYTLGDLWPPVRKALQKTDVANAADEIDRWLHLRNLVGAHYNEWATVVSTSEARQFGEAVLRLYDGVKCDKCGDWIASTRQNNVYECKCRALSRQPLASTGRA